ncbi:hypothetical protein C1H46_015923 [Malus baccata]|uniref:EF-hand domain-containing protein n=1 Tax=Malus baccata TaxID=106549 RepID=A0A540MI64_MALBA|nr:hypothetical protein C1H46_015923 [Malus baccata]
MKECKGCNYPLSVDQPEVPYTEEQIRKVFKSFDKNTDGQLSKAELQAAFAKLGAKWTSVRAWLSLWHADDNGDHFISLDNELDKLVDYVLKLGYTH